ncbi:hypothetical protein [Sediminibacterium sp. TEGAF015]|uniref:hypothetical protein n=1 Tax=Sediminibacterium sp. TEGAF015 TaxID=575378 RepID=UPI0022031A2F|nr:hypothetical protein [Sediminibacterium sp. TEGAF015]BDQ11822.1 hypothetical protein TEGAF0_10390 [Sediminibacterium sp. TEGAF015]
MATDNTQVLKIEKVFAEFLEELEKQPVSKQKAIEMQHLFLHTMEKAYKVNSSSHTDDARGSEEIVLDMDKLLRQHRSFSVKNLPDKAINWAAGLAYSGVGLLFITVGFLTIVTPTSAEFEIATLFYFNDHDGFTVLDAFALVVIFIGIFFFIKAFVAQDKKE